MSDANPLQVFESAVYSAQTGKTADTSEAAPSGAQDANKDLTDESTQPKDQAEKMAEILELDKLERFKWQGKEWTLKDLKNATLMQSDYTKKTKALAEERKYSDNFTYDAMAVLQNPALREQFEKIYPEAYRSRLDNFLGKYSQKQGGSPESPQETETSEEPKYLSTLKAELNQIKSALFEKEVATQMAQIDNIVQKMTNKYPLTGNELIQEAILARASQMANQGELSEEAWEKLFSDAQKSFEGAAKSYGSEQFKKQKAASEQAKDVAPGGGIAVSPPQKMALKDVREYMLSRLAQ